MSRRLRDKIKDLGIGDDERDSPRGPRSRPGYGDSPRSRGPGNRPERKSRSPMRYARDQPYKGYKGYQRGSPRSSRERSRYDDSSSSQTPYNRAERKPRSPMRYERDKPYKGYKGYQNDSSRDSRERSGYGGSSRYQTRDDRAERKPRSPTRYARDNPYKGYKGYQRDSSRSPRNRPDNRTERKARSPMTYTRDKPYKGYKGYGRDEGYERDRKLGSGYDDFGSSKSHHLNDDYRRTGHGTNNTDFESSRGRRPSSRYDNETTPRRRQSPPISPSRRIYTLPDSPPPGGERKGKEKTSRRGDKQDPGLRRSAAPLGREVGYRNDSACSSLDEYRKLATPDKDRLRMLEEQNRQQDPHEQDCVCEDCRKEYQVPQHGYYERDLRIKKRLQCGAFGGTAVLVVVKTGRDSAVAGWKKKLNQGDCVVGKRTNTLKKVFKQSYERELKSLKRLRGHPNILSLAGESAPTADDPWGHLFLEFCSLGDVFTLNEEYMDLKKFAPEGFMLELALSMSSALAWMHEGTSDWKVSGPQDWRTFIHNDIKMDNIFMKPQRPGTRNIYPRFVLGDFGCTTEAREVAESGCLMFMSPQRVSKDGPAEPSDDMYSLGCTLFYMANHEFAFKATEKGDPLFEHRTLSKGIYTTWFNQLIMSCTSRSPSKRPTARKLIYYIKREIERNGYGKNGSTKKLWKIDWMDERDAKRWDDNKHFR